MVVVRFGFGGGQIAKNQWTRKRRGKKREEERLSNSDPRECRKHFIVVGNRALKERKMEKNSCTRAILSPLVFPYKRENKKKPRFFQHIFRVEVWAKSREKSPCPKRDGRDGRWWGWLWRDGLIIRGERGDFRDFFFGEKRWRKTGGGGGGGGGGWWLDRKEFPNFSKKKEENIFHPSGVTLYNQKNKWEKGLEMQISSSFPN